MTELRKGIPKGKTRVIGIDLFSHEDYIVKDCDTVEEAFKLADDTNKERKGAMDGVYYVYDDTGKYIRGAVAVSQFTNGLGVSA